MSDAFAHGAAQPSAPPVSGDLRFAGATSAPLLDAERLDAYRVALEFQSLCARLVPRKEQSVLRDQLERASVSIVLNVAEGAGRFSGPDKARFYAMARGSATECAAIVDLLFARGLVTSSLQRHARGLLIRIVQMLTKLRARVNE